MDLLNSGLESPALRCAIRLFRRPLSVEAQEVVQRLAESGDGGVELKSVMWAVPVVVVEEDWEAI